jgi:hypothetical protein
MTRVRYSEGDWFAVPLRDHTFATGVVARASRDGVLLGYFFGPRTAVVPTIVDVESLTPADAALVGMFGHLGLRGGSWPIIGRRQGWDRDRWPMPVFARYEELTGRWFKSYYDPDDPNRLVREVAVAPSEAVGKPRDGLMGAGYVEIALTRLF